MCWQDKCGRPGTTQGPRYPKMDSRMRTKKAKSMTITPGITGMLYLSTLSYNDPQNFTTNICVCTYKSRLRSEPITYLLHRAAPHSHVCCLSYWFQGEESSQSIQDSPLYNLHLELLSSDLGLPPTSECICAITSCHSMAAMKPGERNSIVGS